MLHVYFVKQGLVSITLPGPTAHAVHAAQAGSTAHAVKQPTQQREHALHKSKNTNDDASNDAVRLHVRPDVANGSMLPRPGVVDPSGGVVGGGFGSSIMEHHEVAVVGPDGWFCEAALLGNPPYPVRCR